MFTLNLDGTTLSVEDVEVVGDSVFLYGVTADKIRLINVTPEVLEQIGASLTTGSSINNVDPYYESLLARLEDQEVGV